MDSPPPPPSPSPVSGAEPPTTQARPQPHQAPTPNKSFFARFQRVAVTDRIFFTQNLEIMVRTGFSLGIALRTLERQIEHKHFKTTVTTLRERVEAGTTLSVALSAHPDAFPELFVNMVSAGEGSGKLQEVLKRLTKQMKKDASLKAKVKGALTYPTIVLIAMIGIGIGMLTFVIPKITEVYADAGGSLPAPTRFLIFISNLLLHQGIYIGIGVIGLGYLFLRSLKTKRGKRLFDRVVLKLPIVSIIVKKINVAQITRTLSSLLATDIPIVTTFKIIEKTLGNVLYQESMAAAAENVKHGQAVVKVLERFPNLYPPVVTQMVAIGEESGTLDSVTSEVADFYEEEVDQTMSNLSTILEPVMILIIGAGVAGMALAVMLPIYNLGQQIS